MLMGSELESAMAEFDARVRGKVTSSMPDGLWSSELLFAIADRHLAVRRPSAPEVGGRLDADAKANGAYVESVARQLFLTDRDAEWRRLFYNGLNAYRPWKGSWVRFATAYFARLGIDFELYIWNWNKWGEAHGFWKPTCEGRRRFLVALQCAVEQTDSDIEKLNTTTLKELRLQRAYAKTWGELGLQAMLDAGFPTRKRPAAARKGALERPESTADLVRRASIDILGTRDVESLTTAQAVRLEHRLKRLHPGLAAGGRAWRALRRLNPSLPRTKPRHPSLRLPNLDFSEATRLLREALDARVGADWHGRRDGRLAARRLLLGLGAGSESRKRSLHRGLEELGLRVILVPRPSTHTTLRADAARIAVAAAPEAVHELDFGARNRAMWESLRWGGEAANYMRWVYRKLFGVDAPSSDPGINGALLSAYHVQYLSAYPRAANGGGLRPAVADAFGQAEVERCRWLHAERGTSSDRGAGIQKLRETAAAEIGSPLTRASVRAWLRSVGFAGGLKRWIEMHKLVTWVRGHYSGSDSRQQVAVLVDAFESEGLRPWDVPRFGFRSASPLILADVVCDYWRQLDLDPTLDPQQCADALSYGRLVSRGLGGLLHVRFSATTSLARKLAALGAPTVDWRGVRFTDQDELCRLGCEFEDAVLRAFEIAGFGEGDLTYQQRLEIDADIVIPDFSIRSERLQQLLLDCSLVDAKLSSTAAVAATNVTRMGKAGAVLVVHAVLTAPTSGSPLQHMGWDEFADAIGLQGTSRRRLDSEVERLVRRRGDILAGRSDCSRTHASDRLPRPSRDAVFRGRKVAGEGKRP